MSRNTRNYKSNLEHPSCLYVLRDAISFIEVALNNPPYEKARNHANKALKRMINLLDEETKGKLKRSLREVGPIKLEEL